MNNRLLHRQWECSKKQRHEVINDCWLCARFALYLVFVKLTIRIGYQFYNIFIII